MKRFWLVLLSLGLVMAFSASAFAVDVKFSGSYYAAGMYLNKVSNVKAFANDDSVASAFYFQRLRVQTEFVASPGLSLITRFDALERVWGGARSVVGGAADSLSMGSRNENENIAFDMAYIQWVSPVGLLRVGIIPGGGWGTVFADSVSPRQRLLWIGPNMGGFTVLAVHETLTENSRTAVTPASVTSDLDYEDFQAAFYYANKNINAGLAYAYLISSTSRTAAVPFKSKFHLLIPYAIVNVGPVKIQAELDYYFGDKYREYEVAGVSALTKVSSLAGWINAQANIGPAYVGATVAYSQGQADQDLTKDTLNQVASGGADWNPCLIMFNYDLTYWQGGIAGVNGYFTNAWLYQINGGIKPTEKLDIGASFTYASRDTVLANVDKGLGWEVDVTATYKITNNLSYMLGVGYLATGDYFKGANKVLEVSNDYLVINKLTLTF